MPSWQARLFNAYVRTFVRRDSWGADPEAVAKRARRTFGAPAAYQWLVSRGLNVTKVDDGRMRGEWVSVPEALAGIVLYIHGGGFISCSAESHRSVTAAIAMRTRRRVFSVDYRLGPEHPFPSGLDDIVVAYKWLLESDIPPSEIAVVGDSAGGGLVLSLMIRLREEQIPMPVCGVCLSAWTDLSGASESVTSNNGECHMFRPRNIDEFSAAYLNGTSPRHEFASPVYADLSSLPPILMQVGSTELLLDDSRRVYEKIINSSGLCDMEIYDDLAHGWHLAVGLVPEADEALRSVSDFITRNTTSQPEIARNE